MDPKQYQPNIVNEMLPQTPTDALLKSSENQVAKVVVTVGVSVHEAYSFFRDFKNLSSFMKDIKEIQVKSPTQAHWVAETKDGDKAEWDTVITFEREAEQISWKSTGSTEVQTSGSVWFTSAPAGKGCEISLVLGYAVPGGGLSEWLAGFTGESTEDLAKLNLRRLKVMLETGEVSTIDGQPSGRDADASEITTH